jgi:hypothetical protein
MGLSTNGRDMVARGVGGDTLGYVGTATASSATTLTDSGGAFTASSGGPPALGGLVGHIVVAGSAAANLTYGVIISNTSTVLTVDQWHSATAPETVASTPSATAPYVVCVGGAPAFYMGISVATRVFTAADTVLTNDGTTVSELWFSGGGLRRRLASWAHTNGTATYTVANTFTANGSDTLPQTIAKIGIFQHFVNTTVTTSNSGIILFQTLLSATATLSASGDNVQITDTVTVS